MLQLRSRANCRVDYRAIEHVFVFSSGGFWMICRLPRGIDLSRRRQRETPLVKGPERQNDTPFRRLANSAVIDKLLPGRHQKVALNPFLRFDSRRIDPKGEILLLLRRDESCFER